MNRINPVWKILTTMGAIPYLLLILLGIHGALFGSPFNPMPLFDAGSSFLYAVLPIHTMLWPIFLISFILLNIGAWGWFLEAYHLDSHPGRILLFLFSIGPMLYTIASGILIGSTTGIMLEGFFTGVFWGFPAMIPWAIRVFTDSWYFHIAPLVCFPLCVSSKKFE